ncbi:MAG: hypothetical protein H0W66_00970 [Chthoniobacterales bacterium]|nr:hypothetical protein [Chthoniobacterales bacterium]
MDVLDELQKRSAALTAANTPAASASRTAQLESGLDDLQQKAETDPTARDLGVAAPTNLPATPEFSDAQVSLQTPEVQDLSGKTAEAQFDNLPSEPQFTWGDIEGNDRYKQATPQQKESILLDHTSGLRDFLQSQTGANAPAIDQRVNDFIKLKRGEIFPEATPDTSIGHRLLDAFRRVPSAIGQDLNATAAGLVEKVTAGAGQSSIFDKLVPDPFGVRAQNRAEAQTLASDLAKPATDFLGQNVKDIPGDLGVDKTLDNTGLARTGEVVGHLGLGLAETAIDPALFFAQSGLSAYHNKLSTLPGDLPQADKEGSADRALYANLATNALFLGQGAAVTGQLEKALVRTGVTSEIAKSVVKAAGATAANALTRKTSQAGEAAIEGQDFSHIAEAFNHDDTASLAQDFVFGLHGAKPIEAIKATARQYGIEKGAAQKLAAADLPAAAKAQDEAAEANKAIGIDVAREHFQTGIDEFDKIAAEAKGAEVASTAENAEQKTGAAPESTPATPVTEAEVTPPQPEAAPKAEEAASSEPTTLQGRVVQAVRSKGGITVNLKGEEPNSGFAFAPSKETETKIPADQFNESHVDQFLERYREALGKGEAAHLGGWLDDNGVPTLDISTVHHAKVDALVRAQAAGQDAIHDLSTHQDIKVNEGLKQHSDEDIRAAEERHTGQTKTALPPVDQAGRDVGEVQGADSGDRLRNGPVEKEARPRTVRPSSAHKSATEYGPEIGFGTKSPIAKPSQSLEALAHGTARDLNKAIKLPTGATALRATDEKGRVSIVPEKELKGSNPLHEAGPFKKIEAGAIGKDKKFIPAEGEVTLKSLAEEDEDSGSSVKGVDVSEELGSPESSEAASHEDATGDGASDAGVRGSAAAHETATVQAAAEALRGAAPADLANQVGKRYATVNKLVDERVRRADQREIARQSMHDLLRDDLVKNAQETGDPFKAKTASGKTVDYSVEARLLGTAERQGGKLTNFLAKKANQEVSGTIDADSRDEAAAHVDEPATTETPAEKAAAKERDDFVGNLHQRIGKIWTEFSTDKNNHFEEATAAQVVKAAKLVMDEIGQEKGAGSFGFGEKRGLQAQGGEGVVLKLTKNPKFREAVEKQIFDRLATEVRGQTDRGILESKAEGEGEKVDPRSQVLKHAAGLADRGVPLNTILHGLPEPVKAAVRERTAAYGGTTKSAMRAVAERAPGTVAGQMQKALAKVLEGAVGDERFIFDPTLEVRGDHGLFNPRSRDVSASPFLSEEALGWTALHEASHAVLYSKTEAFKSGDYQNLTSRDVEAFKELEKLRSLALGHESVHESIREAGKAETLTERQLLFRQAVRGGADFGHYGLIDLHEFMTQATTDARFQKFLNELPAPAEMGLRPKATMWDAVKRVLRALVLNGKPVAEDSVLARAFDRTIDLIKSGSLEDQAAAKFAEGGPFESPAEDFKKDAEKQTSFLKGFAGAHGFKDVNTMVVEDPHLFNEAAKIYRSQVASTVGAREEHLLSPAAEEPEIQDETAQRAKALYAKLDPHLTEGAKSAEVIREAMAGGASSMKDFAKAFEKAGMRGELAQAAGRAVESHFTLAAFDRAQEIGQAKQELAETRSVIAEKGATVETISKLDEAKAEQPPVRDPASPAAQEKRLLPHYLDINKPLAKKWGEVTSFWKSRKPSEYWAAWNNAADTKAAVFAEQKTNDLRGALRDAMGRKETPQDAKALSFVVESRGDKSRLAEFKKQISDAVADPKVKGSAGWKKAASEALGAIDHAEKNFDQLSKAAEVYSKTTGDQIALEHLNGLNTPFREGYVPHLQDLDKDFNVLFGSGTGTGGGSTGFKKMRSYDSFAESLAAGVKPETLNAVDLLSNRLRKGNTVLNKQQWAESGRALEDPTTKTPLIADIITETHPVTGDQQTRAPQGYQIRGIGNRQIAVHEGYAGLFDAFTAPSALRNSVVGRAALATEGAVKHGLLLFDSFHLGRLAYYQLPLRGSASFRKGLLTIDYSAGELQKMESRGELPKGIKAEDIIKRKADADLLVKEGYNVGGITEAMNANIVQKLPVIGGFNKFVFQQFQRGGMVESGLIELARQRKAFPELSEQEVARKVARELNTRFGNLQKEGWFKSATMRDLAQLTLLAPSWNEGLLKSELGAGKELGQAAHDLVTKRQIRAGSLLKGSGTMLLGTFVFNQLLNYATRGQPTWQNKEEGLNSKISAWIPDVIGGGPGFFLNPMTLPAELTHQVLEVMDGGASPVQALTQVSGYKFAPTLRVPYTAFTRTDRFGRTLKSDWDVAKEMISDVLPTPISISSMATAAVKSTQQGKVTEPVKGAVEKQAFSSLGVKLDSAPSDGARIFNLAKEFNKKNGITPDPRFSGSDYSKLTQAINVNDAERAQGEFSTLAATKTQKQIDKHYRLQVNNPFSGSKTRERAFFNSLSAEQKDTYHKAVDAKRKLRDDYLGMKLRAPKPTS